MRARKYYSPALPVLSKSERGALREGKPWEGRAWKIQKGMRAPLLSQQRRRNNRDQVPTPAPKRVAAMGGKKKALCLR